MNVRAVESQTVPSPFKTATAGSSMSQQHQFHHHRSGSSGGSSNDHRVVAFPRGRSAGGGLPERRGRSLSAGRTRKSSQELVQDIYDRMGLTRQASSGQEQPDEPSPERYQNRYRAAANLTSRGRTLEELEENRRARSLSRGRNSRVTGRWPPGPPEEPPPPASPKPRHANTGTIHANVTSSTTTANTATTTNSSSGNSKWTEKALASIRSSDHRRKESQPAELSPYSYATSKSLMPASAGGNHNSNKDEPVLSVPSDTTTLTNPGVPTDESPMKQSGFSIQDRISAYGGVQRVKSARSKRPVDKQYAAKFSVREHPPKINIYEPSAEEKKDDEDSQHQQPPPPPPILDDEMSELKPTCLTPPPPGLPSCDTSKGSRKSANLADRFLSSIKATNSNGATPTMTGGKKPSSLPLLEISADPDTSDNVSVSMSSVTGCGEEYPGPTTQPPLSYRGQALQKKSYLNGNGATSHILPEPHRNRVPKSSSGVASKQQLVMDEAAIQKLVEERVQAKLAGIEARLDEKYRQLLQSAEERWSSQLAILEAQIQGTGL